MRRFVAFLAVSGIAMGSAACDGCSKKSDPSLATTSATVPNAPASGGPAGTADLRVVAESLPRCRIDGARLAIPGDDVVAGDAEIAGDGILLGVVRRDGAKRLASVVRASLDLASLKVVDVGPTLGDDPPPSPRMRGATAYVTSFARGKSGAAAGPSMTRILEIARFDGSGLVVEGSVIQQADESLAYDVAWPIEAADKPGIVAWDEDAPPRAASQHADRGVIKVQMLGGAAKARVASPEASDAEAPRLLARRGGYWLAWLARRAEAGEDAGASAASEGPGEHRIYRWVELVALDAKGEPTSPVRRVSPEKGRVASFDLAAAPHPNGGDPQLVVVVQDEAAHAEGAGERIVRYAIDADKVEAADLLDGGVGHALAELVPQTGDGGGPRWLSFGDPAEHAHLVPLGPALRLAGAPTAEPALDGARIVASAPPDVVYAVGPAGAPGSDAAGGRIELRRLICR